MTLELKEYSKNSSPTLGGTFWSGSPVLFDGLITFSNWSRLEKPGKASKLRSKLSSEDPSSKVL